MDQLQKLMHCNKMFKNDIREQMMDYLDEHQYFSSIHFRFRSKYSTTDALLFAIETMMNINDDEFDEASFLDLSKVFDSKPHEKHNEHLQNINVDGNLQSLI